MSKFNASAALVAGKAITRDGRKVFELKEAILNGKEIIIGCVSVAHRGSRLGEKIIEVESAYWSAGGLGRNGHDDLMNTK